MAAWCEKCERWPAVKTILAMRDREVRETHLCRFCADQWRQWVKLIYGYDPTDADRAGGKLTD